MSTNVIDLAMYMRDVQKFLASVATGSLDGDSLRSEADALTMTFRNIIRAGIEEELDDHVI